MSYLTSGLVDVRWTVSPVRLKESAAAAWLNADVANNPSNVSVEPFGQPRLGLSRAQ